MLRARPVAAMAAPPGAVRSSVQARLQERAVQSREIVYFLQQPETHAFDLYHDYTESRAGTDHYINVVRAGSRVSNPSARSLDTGEPLRLDVLKGAAITAAKLDIGEAVTPNTEIDVLVMDLRSQPFSNQRLIYDMYDYRDYSDPANEPVETNRDPSLYCRALRLQDDNTFNGQGACDGLKADGSADPEEKCLYTYAKVVDRALVQGTSTAVYPSLAQIDLT